MLVWRSTRDDKMNRYEVFYKVNGREQSAVVGASSEKEAAKIVAGRYEPIDKRFSYMRQTVEIDEVQLLAHLG